jgi:hypothetical protein
MKTSLDTNVLIALWDQSAGMNLIIAQACERVRQSGPILIHGPVLIRGLVLGERLSFPRRHPLRFNLFSIATRLRLNGSSQSKIGK